MKVIGAGLGRTGTMSLKAALERLLEGRCHHMMEVVRDDAQVRAWHAWACLQHVDMDWHSLYADFVACCDAPSCFVYEELMEVYPDAKVVLTLRDPERWYTSWEKLVTFTRRTRPLRYVVPRMRYFDEFIDTLRQRYMGGTMDREASIQRFLDHNKRVQEVVPPERLLVYEVKQGWQPLCEFLDVPIPDEPFPRLNQGVDTIRRENLAIIAASLRDRAIGAVKSVAGIVLD